MIHIDTIRKHMIPFAAAIIISTAAYANDGDRTVTIKLSKTVDGKKTEKTEVIKVKEKEDVETAVKKIEDEFTKDAKDEGKKIKIEMNVKVTDENGKEIRNDVKLRSETIDDDTPVRNREERKMRIEKTERAEEKDGKKEIRKEKKIIIE